MDQSSQRMLVDLLSSEMDRFWTRFNIFSAVQVAAMVGLFNVAPILVANPSILRFVLLFLICFSITGAIAVVRGHDIQRSIILALEEVEEGLTEEQQTFSRIKRNYLLPTYTYNLTCSAFALLCCAAWGVAWIWLERTAYAGLTIPNP